MTDRQESIARRKRDIALLRETRARLTGTPLDEKSIRLREHGEIDSIWIDAAHWVRDEEAIWKLAPKLRHVQFTGLHYQCPGLISAPAPDAWHPIRDQLDLALKSGRIASLGIMGAWLDYDSPGFPDPTFPPSWSETDHRSDSVADELARWLIETKKMATLRGLHAGSVEPRTLEMLAAEPTAAQLEDIELDFKPTDDATLAALATTKLAPQRIVLNFAVDPPIFDHRLTESPFLSRVTDLTVPGLSNFATVGPRLKRLALNLSFEPGWLERIASAPELSNVEELVLVGVWTESGTLDLRPFYEPKHLESLRVLGIQKGVTAQSVGELLRSPLGRRLEVIDNFTLAQEPAEAHGWDGVVVNHGP